VPTGYEVNHLASDCITPDSSILNADGDGTVDIEPVIQDFGDSIAVLCAVTEIDAPDAAPGTIGAGQAATARVELRRLNNGDAPANTIRFTVGSLARDISTNNNTVTASLTQPPTNGGILSSRALKIPVGPAVEGTEPDDTAGSTGDTVEFAGDPSAAPGATETPSAVTPGGDSPVLDRSARGAVPTTDASGAPAETVAPGAGDSSAAPASVPQFTWKVFDPLGAVTTNPFMLTR
jgi:hypothetical protein